MLHINFKAFTKVELWDLTVCIAVNREIIQSRSDLGLGPTMPNIELVQDIFIYNNVFKFNVQISFLDRLLFKLSCKQKPHTHRCTHTHIHTHTHTDSYEYSIVAFCKNATIINELLALSENTQAWQCLKVVFIWSDELTYRILTSQYVINLRYRPHYSIYKDLYNTPQNQSTVTT